MESSIDDFVYIVKKLNTRNNINFIELTMAATSNAFLKLIGSTAGKYMFYS